MRGHGKERELLISALTTYSIAAQKIVATYERPFYIKKQNGKQDYRPGLRRSSLKMYLGKIELANSTIENLKNSPGPLYIPDQAPIELR